MGKVYKEIGDWNIEVVENRRGKYEGDDGLVRPTYNCYAGIGYIVDDNLVRTSEIVAWAGDHAGGEADKIDNFDLDVYLLEFDEEYQADFRAEGIMS